MNDWYAQRLAKIRAEQQGQQAPPPPPAAGPQHYPPTQLPAHLAPYAAPQQQAPYAAQPQPGNGQYGPAGTPAAPPQMAPGQQFYSYNAETGAQVADDGHVAALYNSAAQTGGSTVVKNNSTTCPNCGSGNYFTIQEGGVFSKSTGGRVNAMQCADCNYPQVQAGSTNGSLQGVRTVPGGAAHKARQLPANHRVTVAVEGGGTATFEPPTGAR